MLSDSLRRFLHRLNGSNRVLAAVGELRREVDRQAAELVELRVAAQEALDRLADLEQMALDRLVCALEIVTEHPVASYSDDDRFPRGVRNDNTRHPRFVQAVESLFAGRTLRHLDLGCAGGGLVLDFLLRGHESAGVEGSRFAMEEQRAEWRVIPTHLFTADITRPFSFRVKADHAVARFDVITAWEVLEHLPEDRLPGLFANLRSNLAPDGIFVGSVATFEDNDADIGAIYHVTIKPREWWLELFARHGLRPFEAPFHTRDYVRGSGNPRSGPSGRWDWDAARAPQMGFHVTLRASA